MTAIGGVRLTEESQYLAFSGLRVHFRVARPDGPAGSRALLLSSPWINTFHWRKLLPELAALGCLTAVVDMPGFGRGDCGAPQDEDSRARLVWGVLDELDRRDEAPMSLWHLAGHGTACRTILAMAALCPDSVKSQIHIAPTFSANLCSLSAGEFARWHAGHIADERGFRRMIEGWAGYPMDDYIVDSMRWPLMRRGAMETVGRMLRQAAKPPRRAARLCPAMALLGGRDPLPDAQRLEEARALLPEAEHHRLATAGHFPMETHSLALRDYLRGWLRYNE